MNVNIIRRAGLSRQLDVQSPTQDWNNDCRVYYALKMLMVIVHTIAKGLFGSTFASEYLKANVDPHLSIKIF
jgi:hypothetical protein